MVKARLKTINIAGTWRTEVELELHGHSVNEIGNYLLELNGEIQKMAKHIGNKPKHKVNLKKVTVITKLGK